VNAGQEIMAKAMSEADLEGHIAAKCKALGLARYHTFNSQRSPSGFPDDVIVGPAGMLYRECKRMGKNPTASQQDWLDRLAAVGCDVGVWRPSDLFDGTIDRELLALSGRR
jgi:hypothetical protein